MAGSLPNFQKIDSRSACIQGVLKVKVKGHVVRALSWILGMSYSTCLIGLIYESRSTCLNLMAEITMAKQLLASEPCRLPACCHYLSGSTFDSLTGCLSVLGVNVTRHSVVVVQFCYSLMVQCIIQHYYQHWLCSCSSVLWRCWLSIYKVLLKLSSEVYFVHFCAVLSLAWMNLKH